MPSGSGPEGGKALCDGVWRNREPRTVLGHRMDEDVYSAYRTFAEKYCDKTLRRDVYPGLPPCANTPSVWFRGYYSRVHGTKTIKECDKSFQAALTEVSGEMPSGRSVKDLMLNKLPRDLPTNPCMKPFIIGATDKRRGLRGQWGVRATANLAAGTFLGMYRGRVSFLKNYDEEKLKGPGSNGHENAMTNDAYCATIQHFNPCMVALTNKLAGKIQFKGMAVANPDRNELVVSAHGIGNITCIINDPLVDPFDDTDDSRVGEANTAMIEVFIGPWPFMAMFTVKDVKKGQELLCNYGHSYWNISRENMRRVAVERERQKEQLKGSMPLDVAQPEGSNAAAGSRDGCAAVSDVLIPSTSAAAPSASNQSLPETEVLGEDEECDEEYEDEEECGEEFDEEEEEEEDVEQEEEDQEEEEEAVEEDVESPPSSLSIRLGDSEEYAEFSGDGSGEVEGPSEEDADQDMQPEQGEGEQQQDDFDAGSGFEDDPEQADEGDGAGPSGYVAAPAPGLTGPAGGRDAGRDEAGPSTAPVSEPLEVLQRKLGSMKVFVQCKQKNLEDAAGQLPPSCNWRWVGQAAWYYNDVLEDGRERMIGPCTLLDLQKCLDDELIAGGTRIFVFGDVPAGMSPAERQALSQQHGSGLRVEDVVDAAQHTLCYAQAAEDLSQARKMRDDIQQKIDAALRPSAAPEQVHVGGSGGDEAGPSGTPAGRTGRPVVIQRCKKKGTPATLSPLRNDGRFAKRFVGLKEEPGGGSSGEPQRNVRRRLDTDAGEAGGGGRAATENVGPQEIEVIELLD